MARPRTLNHEDFISAAMRIVDTEGLEELTFRRLGEEVGVSYTAVYTYFESRQDLVEALVGRMLLDALTGLTITESEPRAWIIAVARAVRAGLARHPRAIPAFLVTSRNMDESKQAVGALITALERSGLADNELALAYRTLESYVLGTTIFDFGAAPAHLEIRRRRYEDLGHPAFAAVARSAEVVEDLNETAFVAGLERILDGFGI